MNSEIEFSDFFFRQLSEIVESSRYHRECPVLEDLDWLRYGIERVLDNKKSGRDFVQDAQDYGANDLTRSNFFSTLSSKRRSSLAEDVNKGFIEKVGINSHSLFEGITELDGREIHAIDGHHIAHGCHAPKTTNNKGELMFLTSHILYSLNLRNNMISPFVVAGSYAKKEHEINALKRDAKKLLKRGKRPLWILDRAYFDAPFWNNMLRQGIYTIQRLKENIKPISRIPLQWDISDPINLGVIDYELVSQNNAGSYYVITYQCPQSKEVYEFATTDKSLRPGVVAFLYYLRWRIEKVYDVFKNELAEKKAWAASETSKLTQASLTCLTYNLLVHFEDYLAIEHGVVDTKSILKRSKRINKRLEEKPEVAKRMNPIYNLLLLPARMSSQFIRGVLNHINQSICLKKAIDRFTVLMQRHI